MRAAGFMGTPAKAQGLGAAAEAATPGGAGAGGTGRQMGGYSGAASLPCKAGTVCAAGENSGGSMLSLIGVVWQVLASVEHWEGQCAWRWLLLRATAQSRQAAVLFQTPLAACKPC